MTSASSVAVGQAEGMTELVEDHRHRARDLLARMANSERNTAEPAMISRLSGSTRVGAPTPTTEPPR